MGSCERVLLIRILLVRNYIRVPIFKGDPILQDL